MPLSIVLTLVGVVAGAGAIFAERKSIKIASWTTIASLFAYAGYSFAL